MKKIILPFLLLCFAAGAFAQAGKTFLTELPERTKNAQLIKDLTEVYNLSCPQDGDPAACFSKLNLDSHVFQIKPAGNGDLILFLMSWGFGLKAYYMGDEIFNLMARLQMPFDEKKALALESIIETAAKPDPDFKPYERNNEIFKELVTAKNLQTGYNALHNAALYTPVNNNIKFVDGVQQNAQPSFQITLLDGMSTNKSFQPYFCEALAASDKSGLNALNLAVNSNNKQAFFNLILAAHKAGCSKDDMDKILNNPGTANSVFAAAAKNNAKNKDSFYFDAIKALFPQNIRDTNIQSAGGTAKNNEQTPAQDQEKIKKAAEKRANKATKGLEKLGNPSDLEAAASGADKTASSSKQSKKNKQEKTEQTAAAPVVAANAETKAEPQQNPGEEQNKKHLPVTPENLSQARANLSVPQKEKALQQLNRIEADKALGLTNKDKQTRKDQAAYIKTMLAKGSPFANFDNSDKDKNQQVVAAYNKSVEDYKKSLGSDDDNSVTQLKLKQCDVLAGALRKGDKRAKAADLETIQQDIIDASGGKYIDHDCFYTMKNDAGGNTAAPARKEIEELTPVAKTSSGAQPQPAAGTVNTSPAFSADDLTKKLPLEKHKYHGSVPEGDEAINPAYLMQYYGGKNFALIQKRVEQLVALQKDIVTNDNAPDVYKKEDALKAGFVQMSKDINKAGLSVRPAMHYYSHLLASPLPNS